MTQPTHPPTPADELQELLPGVPIVESPFFWRILDTLQLDDVTREAAISLHEKGYAVVDFVDPEFQARSKRVIEALEPLYDWEFWRNEGWKNNSGLRVQDAWRFNEDVRAIALNATILGILGTLYGRRPRPFQTLNFPVGTQQHFHTDSVHFSSVPERFMCGVWVALEDVDETCGPLVYYPGSHKLPVFVNEHVGVNSAMLSVPGSHYPRFEALWRELMSTLMLEQKVLCARKGQALIWAANLLHGGMRHLDRDRTRWSQVTHYFFEKCAYYTPIYSDPVYGRTWFRDNLVDIWTGERMVNCYVDTPIPESYIVATHPELGSEDTLPLPAGFDSELYLAANPDVKAAGMSAETHYRRFGFRERRPLRP